MVVADDASMLAAKAIFEFSKQMISANNVYCIVSIFVTHLNLAQLSFGSRVEIVLLIRTLCVPWGIQTSCTKYKTVWYANTSDT